MKKNVVSLVAFIVLAALTFTDALAQNPQVEQNSTVVYSVTPATGSPAIGSYTWSIVGATNPITPSGIATQSVTWSNIGNGQILRVVPVSSGTLCNGVPQQITVDVVAVLNRVVTINTAAGNVCPAVAGYPAYGDIPSPTLDLSGGAVATGWTFNYYTDVDATVVTSAAMGTSTSNVAANFPSSVKFENTTNANVTHHIYISSWTVDGQTFTPATPVDIAVVVYPAPQLNSITTN